MNKIKLLFLFLLFYINSFSQKNFIDTQGLTIYQKNNKLNIKHIHKPINIDGVLDESEWVNAPQMDSFWRKFPDDLGKSKAQTIVKILYDDQNLYFGFWVKDSHKPFIQSLKRDGGHDGNDCVGIILDPLNKHLNGYFFVLNAHNSQSEDQKTINGDINWSWDTRWFSATKHFSGYWTAEIAIPFKSIRYDPHQKIWGINIIRVDTKLNEYSTWTKLPVNFPSHDLGFTGALYWQEKPPHSKKNISLIPYISGLAYQQTNDNGTIESNGKPGLGLDAKIALNSSLNLDLTTLPDFSQIEVDQQVTNLTRFSINFPEKRTFFLENSDLFSDFGIDPIRPFYSRRIGLNANNIPVPIIAGARISGSLTPKTRIGFMDMQTGEQKNLNYKPQNFSAFTIHQQILKRSTIKTYFLNHENFLDNEQLKSNPLEKFGRNAGIDLNFSNSTGSKSAWFNYNYSIKPQLNFNNIYTEAGFQINNRNFGTVTDIASVGNNYFADLGFIQRIDNYDAIKDTVYRLGFKHWFQNFSYRIIPKTSSKLAMINFGFETYNIFNDKNFFNAKNNNATQIVGLQLNNQQWNETNNSLFVNFNLKSTTNFFYNLNYNVVNLLFPTNFTDEDPLPIGRYSFLNNNLGYNSDFRKKFSWRISTRWGQFYSGNIRGLIFGFNFRTIPYLNISLRAEYNNLVFPNPIGSNKLFLLTSRVELNFSTKIFWNTFIQYNTQTNTFSINSRFQYRFKPLSDLFIVYTDNYNANDLRINKNRALVVKVNYWFNL